MVGKDRWRSRLWKTRSSRARAPWCSLLEQHQNPKRRKETKMTRDQKIVGIGAASGVATMIAAVAGIYQLWPSHPGFADVGSRLAFAVQANGFAVIPLLLGIITVGNDRFTSEAIDPTLYKESIATQINGRVVENTLQQFVLFLVATTALSASLTSVQMRIIPAAAIVFVVARIAFWIGYRIHPLYRAAGMAATAYLNIGLLGFGLWSASVGS
jgi:uncharacterized MAPEG superfamily protein